MPNAAARMGKSADAQAAGSKAFGLLMGKRLKVVMKATDGEPVVHEGTLRSFDDTRIVLEDNFEFTPLEISEIDSTNIRK